MTALIDPLIFFNLYSSILCSCCHTFWEFFLVLSSDNCIIVPIPVIIVLNAKSSFLVLNFFFLIILFVCLFIFNKLNIFYFWKMFIIVLRCSSCLSSFLFSPSSFSCYFEGFCFPFMLSDFLLSQVILSCLLVKYQTIFGSIVWVGSGWEGLECILWIIRLHFVLKGKQISLFAMDHQMMICGVLSLVLFNFSNSWQRENTEIDHWYFGSKMGEMLTSLFLSW